MYLLPMTIAIDHIAFNIVIMIDYFSAFLLLSFDLYINRWALVGMGNRDYLLNTLISHRYLTYLFILCIVFQYNRNVIISKYSFVFCPLYLHDTMLIKLEGIRNPDSIIIIYAKQT